MNIFCLDLNAGDALSVAELSTNIIPVAGLSLCRSITMPDGRERTTQHIVTSPNMDWIPDLTLDTSYVSIRQDGRFYVHDFTLWPQWYFAGTYYLPYVRRRPSDIELAGHPYRLAWYNMTRADFVQEPGSLTEVGMLKESLAQDLARMEDGLSRRITTLVAEADYEKKDFREILYARRGMHMAAVVLSFAPQTFLMTLQTVTYLQRHFLEALACFEYLTFWKARWLEDGDRVHDVDRSIMGLVTPSLDVAHNHFQMGVPVWLVRPPAEVPVRMKVGSQVCAVGPELHVVKEKYPGTASIFSGPPSSERNRACQTLRNIHLDLDHAAHFRQPGEPTLNFASSGRHALRNVWIVTAHMPNSWRINFQHRLQDWA